MQLPEAIHRLIPPITAYDAAHPVFRLALWSLALILLGTALRRALPFLAGAFRLIGQIGLFLALALIAAPLLHFPFDPAPFIDDQPTESVSGAETRIPLSRDGHFWVQARSNHIARRFLVDTGATLTTLSANAASDMGAISDADDDQITLTTANGTTRARLSLISSLRVGNIIVRHLPVAVAPGMADTNVLGMNFLSQLASWRVEGHTLILVPHHPQMASAAEA